ncbi:MAG: site-specific integrase [Candidatus Thiodiazotropha endolucinida]|nr:tyrosine-type recombinase/integrase [Candidatus Thiodiazotropha taylori]MCW4227090.1 tyrosine-type recombinase/integrase [Candidatus Thiodiazotropha endolucinida]MCG7889720.1 tyrosine-type recombinase/integrase [Candidatus Thiodiazotropha taylori]MCG8034465.1 tyrosine-type recombinase/integrase [Candidatus Thiodiazotropha taylori]MCG8117008.1 tyrosine-type recombinase/integrase [Candidatus Thiodiazotropha taylori]
MFILLLRFCRDHRGIAVERLVLKDIDVALVEAFLDHLANDRASSVRTQNHRLAAIHSFFRYVQTEVPDHMLQCQQVLAIPIRRHGQAVVGYLSREYLSEILAQPDLQTREGRRDAVLLSVLYDTGARVQELVDLNAGDIRLTTPAQVRLLGKGRKMRAVPLMDNTTQLLREHLRERQLDRPECADRPLFTNRQNKRLTRWGVQYILKKHVDAVRRVHPGFTQPVSPHTCRHTKGMHLLQSGVSMDIIRDFLGHADISTTQIYARANLEMKRKALDSVAATSPVQPIPSWKQDHSLLEWLQSL